MSFQSYLSRGYFVLPLSLVALASCLTVTPSQANDSIPSVQEQGNNVGTNHSDYQLCPSTEISLSECFILSTSPSPAKSSQTNIQNYPIDSRLNAAPLQLITPHQLTNTLTDSLASEEKKQRETEGEMPLDKAFVFKETAHQARSLPTTNHPSSFQVTQIPTFPPRDIPPLTPDRPPEVPSKPLPEQPPPSPTPSPEQVLPSSPPPPPTVEPKPGEIPGQIVIERFEFEGNTVISDEELAKAAEKFLNRPLAFAEVYEVRSVIANLYRKKGYITSGAIIPPQTFSQKNKVITIQIVEGALEAIEVRGTRRLNPDYIRSRVALGADKPLNRNTLIEALQLLQLDPLIQNLSAELTAGTRPGSSLLIVQVKEAETFHLDLALNNSRSPNIGSFERRLELTQANLFGQGDGLRVGYANTNGSNTLDAIYTYPLNPLNGTLNFTTSFTFAHVVEPPFNRIDIDADSRYFGLTYRQPLWRNLREEFALGVSVTNQKSKVTIFDVPVRLSPGTEEDGSTTVTALRFFQDWIRRSNRQVFALRSQFTLGLGILGGTTNEDAPDSKFLAWRGQVQWLRLLAPDTPLILRGDLQLSTNPLLRLEQFGLGGQDTVRGYRENVQLADNGASVSAEMRFPILRLRRQNGLLQLAPFFDTGLAWNSSGNPDPSPAPNLLASIGLGLRFQMGDRLSARLDWGIPLVEVVSSERTLQEKGVYFSVIYRIF